jgi:hypothetical protein
VPLPEPHVEDDPAAPAHASEADEFPPEEADDAPGSITDDLQNCPPEMIPILLATMVKRAWRTGTELLLSKRDLVNAGRRHRDWQRNQPPPAGRPQSGWRRYYAGASQHAHPTIQCTMLRSPRAADLSALKQYGISSELFEAATKISDPDDVAVFEITLRLLELVITKRNAGVPNRVRAHQHIPDSLVNEALVRMVEPFVLPPVVELLRFQLNAVGRMAHVSRAPPARERGLILCAVYGEKARPRTMARLLGVSASTVSRWMRNPTFRKEVERFELNAWFEQTDPDGGSATSLQPTVSLKDLGREEIEQLWQRHRHLLD